MRIKRSIINNLKNIPGWKTNRKIVVIECDDWGGIRMPSSIARERMINDGLNISDSRFERYDTLANSEDLKQLYEVIESVKDKSGNHAVMTPIVVVANPDFNKIRESEYSNYYFEPFTKTLRNYYPDDDVFMMWRKGMERDIFMPELHGRDHTAVYFWMKKLQEGNLALRKAFEYGYVSLEISGVPQPVSGFRAEFYFNNEDQKPFLEHAIMQSVTTFRDIFGYQPLTFVPGNGFFHPHFSQALTDNKVSFLNVMHKSPYPDPNGKLQFKRYISGQKGAGLIYYTRNCAFEPTDVGYSGIRSTLEQIAAAFRWGKPAIISTHRVNFVGAIDPSNREFGLKELKELLQTVVKKWPEIEFMSSANALKILGKSIR